MDSPIVDDLAAEQAALDELVCGLDEDQWATPSPAEGWMFAPEDPWRFGRKDAPNRIEGTAAEFARVGVRRMRLGEANTLRAYGPLAEIALRNLKAYL